MTSKHYKWQTHWTVDLEAASATHDSGLVAYFVPPNEARIDHGGKLAIGHCSAMDGRKWGIIADKDNFQAVYEALLSRNGPHNVQQMLSRLSREAGELWVECKKAH